MLISFSFLNQSLVIDLSSILIIVLEVGGLQRNQSWKVAIGGINREAYFGETSKSSVNNWLRNASKYRQKRFELDLQPWKETAPNKYILICTQHNKSHQWRSMPAVDKWLEEQIKQIRKYTKRDIIPFALEEETVQKVLKDHWRKLISSKYIKGDKLLLPREIVEKTLV